MTESKVSPAVEVVADAKACAARVAEMIETAIRDNPRIVLGLATGGTPVEVYRELIRKHREEQLDFSQVTTFNLDEYVGLGPDHPQSYRQFMNQQLFDHINIDKQRTHVPLGLTSDANEHAQQYESMIRDAGGIDLQLLGIGSNGHIAFNEPGSPGQSRTRQVDLTGETIAANSRFFDSIDDVPRHAITMGIGTILDARQIILMATGSGKSEALKGAIEGPVTASIPASFLQQNQHVTFVLDRDAAALLAG